MWFIPTKKDMNKELKKIYNKFIKRDKLIEELRKEIISKEMIRLMIENEVLKNSLNKSKSKTSPSKSKTSLRQIQENKVIRALTQTKKQIAKEKISELRGSMSIANIKDKLISELGISKASFYNYLKELDNDIKIQVIQRQK